MDFQDFQEHKSRQETAKIYEESWSTAQKRLATVVRHPAVEFTVGTLVIFSFVLMILEADAAPEVPTWIEIINILLLVIYTVEIGARLFIWRLGFFFSIVNVFDLSIIAIDMTAYVLDSIFEDGMPSLAALRICRMLRLARSFKVIVKFPQLALIVKGLVSGISAAFYGVGLLLMILTVWSVCAVQFIQPVNERVTLQGIYEECSRCPGAFANVRNSMLTFIQQIIAGDSWGQVTIPIIEEAPETSIFFGLVFISIHITIMNVILAVIVDTALKASQEDVGELLKHKADQYNLAQVHLMDICKEMDADGSGDLTEEEIIGGFDSHADFRDILLSMDIKKEDMHVVFSILDSDMSGTVHYEEFIQELFKMKKHDSHTMLVFIKHYVTEIRRDVREQLKVIKLDMLQTMKDLGHSPHEETDANGFTHVVLDTPGTTVGTSLKAALEEKQKQKEGNANAAPKKDGSWCEAASLKELGEELRHLRKVISDELLLSMKEISQKVTVPLHLAGGLDPMQYGQLQQAEQIAAGGRAVTPGNFGQVPAATPAGRRLQPAASPRQKPTSTWGLRNCCSPQHRDQDHFLREPPAVQKPSPAPAWGEEPPLQDQSCQQQQQPQRTAFR